MAETGEVPKLSRRNLFIGIGRFRPEQKSPAESPSIAKTNTKPTEYSRREILKGGTALAVGALIPGISHVPSEQKSQPEIQTEKKAGPADIVISVDMVEGYDNRDKLKTSLGPLFAPKNMLDLDGIEVKKHGVDLIKTSVDERIVATLIADKALQTRVRHGQLMNQIFSERAQELGYEGEYPVTLPIQEALTEFQFGRDEFNNPWITFVVDEQKIGDMLSDSFKSNSNQQIVRLCLEIGKAKIKHIFREVKELNPTAIQNDENGEPLFYTIAPDVVQGVMRTADGRITLYRVVDGVSTPLAPEELLTFEQFESKKRQHEIKVTSDYVAGQNVSGQIEEGYRSEITEQYSPEYAKENLPRLIRLCKRFPDKLFVVSGGNENSFFQDVRQQMETDGQWADNLLIVAGSPARSNASDLYISQNLAIEISMSSSEAADIVGLLAGILASRGMSNQEIKQTILNTFCEPALYNKDYRILNKRVYSEALRKKE